MNKTAWSEYTAAKQQSSILNFPDVPILAENSLDFILSDIRRNKPASLLDVGAYNRWFEKELHAVSPDTHYFSMDADSSNPHDYYDLFSIPRKFDALVSLATVEHVEYETVIRYFKHFGTLAPRIYITTNNPACPASFFNDIDHKTWLSGRTLDGLLRLGGFESQVFRVHPNGRFNFFRNAVARLVGVDFCGELLGVGRKKDLSGK